MPNQPTIKNRTIFCGDNLDILKGFNSNSIDLIYLDPPFNKKTNFFAPIGSTAEGAEFKDYWQEEDLKDSWLLMLKEDENYKDLYNYLKLTSFIGDKSNKYYLVYMTMRILEMKRVLKDTGSIYLHCDNTMGHYLKLLLDVIFGYNNFRNEIIWNRSDEHNLATKQFDIVTDAIYFYTKSDNYFFNRQYMNSENTKELEKRFPYIEEETGRRYNHQKLEQSSNAYNRHESRIINGKEVYTNIGWRWTQATFDERLEKNPYLIYWTKNGKPRYKNYADEYDGKLVSNLWIDFKALSSNAKEKLGYPTQKPIALLKRIIEASCPEGGVVLDPFCGCATTCVASEILNREWIGIDVSRKAFELVKIRLNTEVADKEDFFKSQNNLIFREDIPQRTDLSEVDLLDSKNKREIKKHLYEVQNGICKGCNTNFHIVHMEVDHIIPRAKGGGDNPENLQLLCSYCNRVKGDRPMEYLLNKIREMRE